jgi:hypothetical protein
VVVQAQAVQMAEAVLLLCLALFLLPVAAVAVGDIAEDFPAGLVAVAVITNKPTLLEPLLGLVLEVEAQETLHLFLHHKATTEWVVMAVQGQPWRLVAAAALCLPQVVTLEPMEKSLASAERILITLVVAAVTPVLTSLAAAAQAVVVLRAIMELQIRAVAVEAAHMVHLVIKAMLAVRV